MTAKPLEGTAHLELLNTLNANILNSYIELYSIDGRNKYKYKITNPNQTISLKNMNSGIYVIKIGMILRKLIVIK